MKAKIVIIFSAILIMVFAGYIFILGEKVIHEESSEGFSVFYFNSDGPSTEGYQEDNDTLKITINNYEIGDVQYVLEYSIGGNKLDKTLINIAGGENAVVHAPVKLLEYLSSQPAGTYQLKVAISWNDSIEFLTKKVTLPNAGK